MNALTVIMAHKGGQQVFDRHMEFWQRLGNPILVYCPFDAPILTAWEMLVWGCATHHSVHANQRFLRLLKFIMLMDYDVFWIFEYDSICLGQLPAPSAFAGNVFHDDRPNSGFDGTTFIHPPLCISRNTLLKMSFPEPECEQGFWDRWVGWATELNGILPYNWLTAGLGYSQNTIQPEHYENARQAVLKGAVMVHGIKSAECLRVLTTAYAERQRALVSQVQPL